MNTSEYPALFYIVVLFYNLLGVAFMWWITRFIIQDAAIPIAQAKAAQPFQVAFMRAVGCGMLMSIATYKESPLCMCLICVPAFILAGFNHCIADMYYALVGKAIGWSFIATILGNICGGILMSNLWDSDLRKNKVNI